MILRRMACDGTTVSFSEDLKGFPHVIKLTRSGGEQVFYRWKNLRHSNSSKVVCAVRAKGKARPELMLGLESVWWWNVCCVDSNVRRTVTWEFASSESKPWQIGQGTLKQRRGIGTGGRSWAEPPHRPGICSGEETLWHRAGTWQWRLNATQAIVGPWWEILMMASEGWKS